MVPVQCSFRGHHGCGTARLLRWLRDSAPLHDSSGEAGDCDPQSVSRVRLCRCRRNLAKARRNTCIYAHCAANLMQCTRVPQQTTERSCDSTADHREELWSHSRPLRGAVTLITASRLRDVVILTADHWEALWSYNRPLRGAVLL